jgi:hypothetical protein
MAAARIAAAVRDKAEWTVAGPSAEAPRPGPRIFPQREGLRLCRELRGGEGRSLPNTTLLDPSLLTA